MLACVYLASCYQIDNNGIPDKAEGYVPVYSKNRTSLEQVSATAPRSIINGGKIYTTGNLLFQVEQDSGIHVIDYTDPARPQKIKFIRSFLCKEVSVKNGFIYTNNLDDLVVIDIHDLNNIRLVSRTTGVFPDLLTQSPPRSVSSSYQRIYFECPDASRGVVIGWKKQTINKPKCWK